MSTLVETTTFTDLLARVEAANGPDRELDAAISEYLYPDICLPIRRGTHHDEPVWRTPDGLEQFANLQSAATNDKSPPVYAGGPKDKRM